MLAVNGLKEKLLFGKRPNTVKRDRVRKEDREDRIICCQLIRINIIKNRFNVSN